MSDGQNFDAAIAAVAQKATTVGAGTTGAAWIFSNEALGVAGLIVAIVGLLINLHFRRKDDARNQALFDAEMEALKGPRHE